MRCPLVLVLTCILTIGCRTAQGPSPNIISGDTISPEESGSVLVMSKGLFCSGTLLTNEWGFSRSSPCDTIDPRLVKV